MSSPLNSPCAPNRRRTDRGSAVITVLILAAVTAVIASGFLFRSSQEARLATRSFFQAAALNLAEAGLEEGLYAANTNSLTSANGWTLVSGSTADYQKIITTGLDFIQASGAIYIRADGATGSTPAITATGVISIPNQPRLVKQLRISGRGTRAVFSNALMTKGSITFSGSASVDAYNSSLGAWNSATNCNDRATIGTDSTLQITGSASIYGFVATNGVAPTVGGSGRIYGATSPGTPLVDPSRVRTDFNTNITDATAPTGTTTSLGNLNSTLTLPRASDLPGPNGRYLYVASGMELNGNSTLTINGPVDIIVNSDATVNGSAQITISNSTNANFNLYSAGTITLNGAGMVNNTNNPAKATIWGTKPSSGSQAMEINGNASFVGTIYAPNAVIQLNGSAGLFGAVVGKTVTIAGSSAIHYDVNLLNAAIPGGPTPGASSSTATGTIAVGAWSELTAKPGSGDAFARDNRQPFNTLF